MAKKRSDTGKKLFDFRDIAAEMPERFYSGDQPNQYLRLFVETHSTPYDQATDGYSVPAFHEAITLSRATAIYHMHTYWSKKPHDAIRQYIRHYVEKGGIVLDPMCGSGGTALAALMSGCKAIAIDRSPAATFITANYCSPHDEEELRSAFSQIESVTQPVIDWLYETKCDRCDGPATTTYTLYSQVFKCGRCLVKVPLFDCVESQGRTGSGKPKRISVCPLCFSKGHIEEISTRDEKLGVIPVLVSYVCNGKCKPTRVERRHNDPEKKKREYFKKYDLARLEEIESKDIPYWFPTDRMMNAASDQERWGMMWRPYHKGINRVCDFYSKRNLWAMSALYSAIMKLNSSHLAPLFNFTSIAMKTSLMMVHNNDGIGRMMKGTLFIPPLIHDVNVGRFWSESAEDMFRGYKELRVQSHDVLVSTQDACYLDIPSNSIDYIFTDPPYSWKVQFGEMNFIWESWLQMDNQWHASEIIVNEHRGMSEAEWADKMRRVIEQCFRVLKPGRWMSLCYHDTSEGTWELLQDICSEAGFLADSSDAVVYIDGTQKSIKQITGEQVARRDLVINFRKPKPDDWRVHHVFIPANVDVPTFNELARQVIRSFLSSHPGSPRDRIYDALVSCMVRKGQMEAHNFDEVLQSVAEEVEQPIKKNLFENSAPDLFGSHIQGRWYLKETAEELDKAEMVKEENASLRLEEFVNKYLRERPEEEGAHYTYLQEELFTIPHSEWPRRRLFDWLPEYFIKTSDGTWRMANSDERELLATLRKAGTLRRIKRFANALVDGVPVNENDRPGTDVDLLDWLRQCRRAGLYDQGKIIYEKGGLNSANLSDEQQIEAEDDYRICARRGSTEDVKPKKKRRKQNDDEE
jgi:16S rRNA G966 N2-methylase RsmD